MRSVAGGEPVGSCGPRGFGHRFGETELQGDPQRIVPVSFRDQDALLALGEMPVAVQDGFYATPYLQWPWVRERVSGEDPKILAAGELNFEQIAAQRPELIIGTASGITEEEYRLLSRIAPTLAQLPQYADFGVPWRETLRTVARAVCRSAAAEERIAAIEQELNDVHRRHPELRTATGLVAMTGGAGGSYWAFGPQDSRSRFLSELGLRQPAEIGELADGSFAATISAERLDLLEADVVLWIASDGQRAELERNPMYQRLDSVREGRVIYLDPDGLLTAAITNTTALNLPYLIEELVPRIVDVVGHSGGLSP